MYVILMIYLYCFLLLIMQINVEKEKNSCLPFLDASIFCKNGKFEINSDFVKFHHEADELKSTLLKK